MNLEELRAWKGSAVELNCLLILIYLDETVPLLPKDVRRHLARICQVGKYARLRDKMEGRLFWSAIIHFRPLQKIYITMGNYITVDCGGITAIHLNERLFSGFNEQCHFKTLKYDVDTEIRFRDLDEYFKYRNEP